MRQSNFFLYVCFLASAGLKIVKLLVDGLFSGVPICRYFRIGVLTQMVVIIAVARSKRPENRFAYANWWDDFSVKVI